MTTPPPPNTNAPENPQPQKRHDSYSRDKIMASVQQAIRDALGASVEPVQEPVGGKKAGPMTVPMSDALPDLDGRYVTWFAAWGEQLAALGPFSKAYVQVAVGDRDNNDESVKDGLARVTVTIDAI